jgi:hypothetical protein
MTLFSQASGVRINAQWTLFSLETRQAGLVRRSTGNRHAIDFGPRMKSHRSQDLPQR